MKDEELTKVECLYEKYKKLLYSEAYKILQKQQLAEEVVQEVFIKIIENINSVYEVDSNRTKNFLCVICRNLSINLYNKNKKEKFLDIEKLVYNEAEDSKVFYEIVVDNENVISIMQAIKELPTIYKDILVLEKIYGYKAKEIAKLLNLSESVVRKRSQRAREILLKRFEGSESANGRQ